MITTTDKTLYYMMTQKQWNILMGKRHNRLSRYERKHGRRAQNLHQVIYTYGMKNG